MRVDWPLEAVFQEEASNHPELLWSKAKVVSIREKAQINVSGEL